MEDTELRTSNRKRAIIACEYCRKRKRRCDGKQPICSLCQHANRADCHYIGVLPTQAEGESGANLNSPGPADSLTSRVDQLNAIINEHAAAIDHIKSQVHPLMTHEPSLQPESSNGTRYNIQHTPGTAEQSSSCFMGGSPQNIPIELLPMNIPVGHGTTSEDLLRTSQANRLLGDYPNNIFLLIERKRKLPEEISLKLNPWHGTLSALQENPSWQDLIRRYFDHVNPKHPILNEETLQVLLASTDLQLDTLDVQGALILMVLALGQVAQASPEAIKGGALPGNQYFLPALGVLMREWPLSFQTDLRLSQALFLAASWYNHLCWPMQAWRMIHMASTNIQHAFLVPAQRGGNPDQDLVRLCWATFLVECDMLAEYHLPRSGIENVVEKLFYPECRPFSNDTYYNWISNLSARRLMNRVHFTIYSNMTDNNASQVTNCFDRVLNQVLMSPSGSSRLLAISTELYNQLHQWWGVLPPSMKPDLEDLEPDIDHGTLLLRFNACGDIIYRPFLYIVCSKFPDSIPDNSLLEPAVRCIRHCRSFLQVAASVTKFPSPFTIINLHSTLAVIINLTIASLCPSLRTHVSDIHELEKLAISILGRWACDKSSIELMWKIATALSEKRQFVDISDSYN